MSDESANISAVIEEVWESAFPVDRCVCFSKTFEMLKASGATSISEIRELFGCTSACGLCQTYIERMLETGETRFAVIESAE